jgi:septum formation protein
MNIYLASKSPRRKELLKMMDVDFSILGFDIPEDVQAGESPLDYSRRITFEKIQYSWKQIQTQGIALRPILCADTEVVVDGKIYGKPLDYQDAFTMLASYAGRSHDVITSVGLKYHDFEEVRLSKSKVYFGEMSAENIHHYLKMNQFLDKAGAYGIQSYISQFIQKIEGCYYSIMGLPLYETRQLLNQIEKVFYEN